MNLSNNGALIYRIIQAGLMPKETIKENIEKYHKFNMITNEEKEYLLEELEEKIK